MKKLYNLALLWLILASPLHSASFHEETFVTRNDGNSLVAISGDSWTGNNRTAVNAAKRSGMTTTSPATFCEGSVTLTSQAEVDAFNCSEVERFLRITGDDITNLDALSSLEKVGALVIENNPNLQNVDGLSSLAKVGVQDRSASFSISNNPMLTNLDGFHSLDSVGGNIIISGNASLKTINGFSLIKQTHSISITGNQSLETVGGFTSVTQMYSYSAGAILHPVELRISGNTALQTINGFSSLRSLNGYGGAFLYITDNDALTSFNGLASLGGVGTMWMDAGLFINNNKSLKNLDGLASFEGIGWGIYVAPTGKGTISISNNLALENVDALSSVTIGEDYIPTFFLNVNGNPSLERCCGLFTLLQAIAQLGLTNVDISNNGTGCTADEIIAGGACIPKVCEGDVTLTSQAEVDAFSCNEIVGSLTISGDDITNVDALSSLRFLRAGLIVENNPNLQNLSGLSSLITVGGFQAIRIANNPSLIEINGFSALTEATPGGIVFEHNNSLTNISGFNALRTIGANVYAVVISDNPSLVGIDGFTSADSISSILIKNNNALGSINGFSNLTTIRGQLEIVNNNALKSFNGFDKITQAITGFLGPSIIIQDNISLENLDGLSSLTIITGRRAQLVISNNPSLANITGLSSLTTIVGGTFGAGLRIENNDALKNIEGLRSLTRVDWGLGGGFFIEGNELLENIDGLSSLRDSGGILEFLTIRVKDNPALTKCCGLFPFFKSIGASRIPDIREVDFSNNGAGCTLEDVLACEGQSISDFSIFDRQTNQNAYSSVDDKLTIDVANINFPFWILQASTLPSEVGSVEFIFDNSITRVQNVFPYQFEFPALELGTHTIVANVYAGPNKTGEKGLGRTLTLTVVNSAAISGFDVVNTSGGFLKHLTEDGRININDPAFKSISIRANAFPDPVSSVKFWLNGQFFRVENAPPYAFNGDVNGIYNPWIVNPGDYTIKAVPYLRVKGKEYEGNPLEVHFKVVRQNLNYAVVSFDLVDTQGSVIKRLNDGDVIVNDQPMTVIANTTGQEVRSVRFDLNRQFYRIENVAPYTLTGDQNGYFNPWTPPAGNFTLTATPYSATGAGGQAGTSLTIHFTLADESNTAAARTISNSLNSFPVSSQDRILQEPEAYDVIVHPVPVDGELHVKILGVVEESTFITILSIQGMNLYRGAYSESSPINTANLKAGVYFLQVMNNNGHQKMVKFIKK